MKKLVGGDYLLDLTPIELEESEDGETYTIITNKEIIEQLTNLKKFVPNPSMVKPVWVKLINGETDEIVVIRGEFKVVDADEFEIIVAIDGYKLKIHIEFTQALNENNDPIDDWYIDTNDAKYLFTSDVQNINAITSSGDLKSVKADEIIENMTGYSYYPSESQTNITKEGIYVGCCKNGNKLTMVFAFNITRTGVSEQQYLDLGGINMPSEILAKIYPSEIDGLAFVDVKRINMLDTFVGSTEIVAYCQKYPNRLSASAFVGDIDTILTLNKTYYLRYEVTILLSDNLVPEQAGE